VVTVRWKCFLSVCPETILHIILLPVVRVFFGGRGGVPPILLASGILAIFFPIYNEIKTISKKNKILGFFPHFLVSKMLENVFEFIYTKIQKYFQKHLLPQCEIFPKKKKTLPIVPCPL
jgi:hypothetical protein